MSLTHSSDRGREIEKVVLFMCIQMGPDLAGVSRLSCDVQEVSINRKLLQKEGGSASAVRCVVVLKDFLSWPECWRSESEGPTWTTLLL